MIKIKNYLINPNYISNVETYYRGIYLVWNNNYTVKIYCDLIIKQYNSESTIIEYSNDNILKDKNNLKFIPYKEFNKLGKESFYEKYEKEFVEKMERIVKNITDNIPEIKEYIDVEKI